MLGFPVLLGNAFLCPQHFLIRFNLLMTALGLSATMLCLTFMCSGIQDCGMKDPCNGLEYNAFSESLCLELLSVLNFSAAGYPLSCSIQMSHLIVLERTPLACVSCYCIIHLLLCHCVGSPPLDCSLPAVTSSYSVFCTISEMIIPYAKLTKHNW